MKLDKYDWAMVIFFLLSAVAMKSYAVMDAYNIDRAVDCKGKPITLAYYQMGGFQHDGKGLDVDLMRELEKTTGCKFSYTVLPRATIWKMLEEGTLMMATSGIPTPERERFAIFSVYTRQKNVLLLHNSVPPHVQTMDEFVSDTHLRFCMVRSFRHGAYYDNLTPIMEKQGRVSYVEDQPQLFKALTTHACDGILAFPINFNKFLREYDMLGKVRMSKYVGMDKATPLGLVFSRAHFTEEDVKAWDAHIYQLRKSGKLFRLHLPYLKMYEAELATEN
jgi:polar amino acid transport system substrate-binding protein